MIAIDDTATFLRKHPEHRHEPVPWCDAAAHRLIRVWRELLESQNGEGVDGCGDTPEDGGIAGHVLREHVPHGASVLFLGAGRGQEVAHAVRNGYAAVGSTVGPMNVAIARETFGLDLRFEDAHCSALPAATFDAVIGLQVLEHSPAPLILVLECARLLRPGGVVIFETPAPKYHSGGHHLHHVLCPTPRQAHGLLEKTGFTGIAQWIGGTRVTEATFDQGDFSPDLLTVGYRITATEEALLDPSARRILSGA